VLFIDRCAWSGALGRALTEARIPFIAHHTQFEHDAPDEIWLSAAADKGWLVVTRDQRIRYRANELAAMRRSRLHVFVFTQGGLTGAETGSILVRCHPAMVRHAAQVPAPAFFSLTRSGEVNPLKTPP
jgi:predicted nuclease of predicted toxin-antitoxin system